MSARVYCALVHWPVRDREGHTITTAVTNLDVHDLARSARTFGLAGYYVVTPIAAQRILVERILEHWRTGAGTKRVPERGDALSLCRPIASVDDAVADITAREGAAPRLVATGASPRGRAVTSYGDESAAISSTSAPTLILFGTGHGLADPLVARADALLAPIAGPTDYNHLSVRAAAGIVLDRLFGRANDSNVRAPIRTQS